MGDDVDKGIIEVVQYHVEKIVDRLRLDTAALNSFTIVVRRMGSREYGCAEETSDLDLYLVVPDEWAGQAKEIRVLLGIALERSQQAMGGKHAPVDQTSNFTLKWTSTKCDRGGGSVGGGGCDVSPLVAVEDMVIDAVSTTKCLAWHFRDETDRETVRNTLGRLRKEGVLNSHGRQATVNQS